VRSPFGGIPPPVGIGWADCIWERRWIYQASFYREQT
jgi:hypothetical protein